MQWTPDVTPGDWLLERIDADWGAPSMHAVVPRGFEAYARILHPATRARPVGQAWPPLPQDRHRAEWATFTQAAPEIDTEHVRWGDVARAFGTSLHPEAQWHRLVSRDDPYGHEAAQDAAGWQYGDPEQGRLDPAVLAAVASTLAAHTENPDEGYVAVWEGWGGLLGDMGSMSASTTIALAAQDDVTYTSHEEMLARSIHNPWNDGYAKERWIPGILSDEISRGPRLALPQRGHVLFTGGITEFTDATWAERMPWTHPESAWFSATPSLMWPGDRAWALVTEIDYDSTVVGGSAALIAQLCADTRLETFALTEGADLSWTGDTINR